MATPPPPTMTDTNCIRPPVPGGSSIPRPGSGRGNGGAGGAKNLRQLPRYHPHRTLALATHNVRTLRTDEKIVELEEELSKMRWDILGLSEIRREGQDTITLDSGNLLFFREGDRKSQGGVGFLVRKSLVNNVVKVDSVSSRVAYLILRITDRYSLKVIQVYAPTSAHPDDEVEAMYEEISEAIHSSKTYFTVVMGDFNAKVGTRNGDELKVGSFGYGRRNQRGQRLVDFMEKEGLYEMNSFFKKRPSRKWTWISPDGSTKNEIDFIMTTKKHIFNDVSVISKVKTGSDHRIVRGTLSINVKLERSRLMKSTLRPGSAQIRNPEDFQLELQNRFQCLAECETADEINNGLVETVHAVGSKFFKTPRRKKPQKLSNKTIKLMENRIEMRLQSSASAEDCSSISIDKIKHKKQK